MAKTIETLVKDIDEMVGKTKGATPSSSYQESLVESYIKQVNERPPKVRPEKTIYFSEMGDRCLRRLFYRYNGVSGEELSSSTKIKFMYGDMLETLVLQLAKDAGHDVSSEQEEVEYVNDATGWRVRGRIDAVIDGAVVDVKSVTKMSEKKFWDGLEDDPFGYMGQLNGYAVVKGASDMGFLTIQKEMGHIRYFPFTPNPEKFAYGFHRAVKAMSAEEPAPVQEIFAPVPASPTSPNEKLCTTCSYCEHKAKCWPSLRAFAYSNKVEYLTKVVKEPAVAEISLTAAGGEEG